MSEIICKNCSFWVTNGKDVEGECRAHSPRIIEEIDKRAVHIWNACWPITRIDDWCGEFVRNFRDEPSSS